MKIDDCRHVTSLPEEFHSGNAEEEHGDDDATEPRVNPFRHLAAPLRPLDRRRRRRFDEPQIFTYRFTIRLTRAF